MPNSKANLGSDTDTVDGEHTSKLVWLQDASLHTANGDISLEILR